MHIETNEPKTPYQSKEFFRKISAILSTQLFNGKHNKAHIKLAYQILYDTGNLKDKLNILYTPDMTTEADQQLQKLFSEHPHEMFLDTEHIEQFNNALEQYIRYNLPAPAINENIYHQLIGKEISQDRSIYTIYFEQHLEQIAHFKLHMERLYNFIKRVIYRVKFNVATEYNNIGPFNYRIFTRIYAERIQFRHRLLTEENPKYPCLKLVFSGLHLFLEPIEHVFSKMIELAPTTSIEQFSLNLYSHVPFFYDTYFELDNANRNKAYEETTKAIDHLHGYIYNGSIQQLPTLRKS